MNDKKHVLSTYILVINTVLYLLYVTLFIYFYEYKNSHIFIYTIWK